MKELISRLLNTVDPQTGHSRTMDCWVQTPNHWIRMIHSERDDLADPENLPSPLSSSDPHSFANILVSNRSRTFLNRVILRLML